MKHIKSINDFLNEQLFSDANRFAKLFGVGAESSTQGSTGASSPISTSRNDESSCPNNDCWTHFGKESFWNERKSVI